MWFFLFTLNKSIECSLLLISGDNSEKKYQIYFFPLKIFSSMEPKIEQIFLYRSLMLYNVHIQYTHKRTEHTLIRSFTHSHKHLKAGIVNAAWIITKMAAAIHTFVHMLSCSCPCGWLLPSMEMHTIYFSFLVRSFVQFNLYLLWQIHIDKVCVV